MNKIYYDAREIAEMLGISKASAYKIIRGLNQELAGQGFLVIQGKVSCAYFKKMWYGFEDGEKEKIEKQEVSVSNASI